MKNVQIPSDFFVLLYKYFNLPEYRTEENEEYIRGVLNSKLDAMERRKLFSAFKNATDEQEREQARIAYLRRVGKIEAGDQGL